MTAHGLCSSNHSTHVRCNVPVKSSRFIPLKSSRSSERQSFFVNVLHSDWSRRHWYHCWFVRFMNPGVHRLSCSVQDTHCRHVHSATQLIVFLRGQQQKLSIVLTKSTKPLVEPGDRRNTRLRVKQEELGEPSFQQGDCSVGCCWTSGDGLLGCVVKRKMTNNIVHTHLFHCGKRLVQSTDQRQLHLDRLAPAQIGCSPTAYLIHKMSDNIYHNQLVDRGKNGFNNQNPSVTPVATLWKQRSQERRARWNFVLDTEATLRNGKMRQKQHRVCRGFMPPSQKPERVCTEIPKGVHQSG